MNTPVKLGIIMDPITKINVAKDSSFAMLLAAQHRGWQIYYMEQHFLFLKQGITYAKMYPLKVAENPSHWFDFEEEITLPLHMLDVVLMRKDPPVGERFSYTTQLLDLAEKQGVLVVNKPQALRDANEKLFAQWFPHCCPPTLVTTDKQQLRDFITEHSQVILKPLNGMGGMGIFYVTPEDPNISVILDTMIKTGIQIGAEMGPYLIMAQKFIPAISQGDKRILMIDGEPIPYALARIPPPGEIRGNLAAGAHGVGMPLDDHDRWICEQIGPTLKSKGLLFVGLDVIGRYLTEINVTSPTCIRELDAHYNINISDLLLNCIEKLL